MNLAQVVESGSSVYPELPSLGQHSPISRRLDESAEARRNDLYAEDDGATSSEYSSLLGNGSATVAAAPKSAGGVVSDDSVLLSDLLRENSRLSDEVNSLKEILSIQQVRLLLCCVVLRDQSSGQRK